MSIAGIAASSFFSGAIPQSTQTKFKQAQQEFQQLGQDLQAGNLGQAQTDLALLQKHFPGAQARVPIERRKEQGRGFAVVADEVRKLAERTRRATKEIAEMIQSIQTETHGAVEVMQAGTQQVKLGVESTTRAGASLREIIQTSEAAGTMVSAIASAAAAQRSVTEEIGSNIEQIAAITQGTAAGAKESAKAVHELSTLAMDLQAMVGKFKVSWAADGHVQDPRNTISRNTLSPNMTGHRRSLGTAWAAHFFLARGKDNL